MFGLIILLQVAAIAAQEAPATVDPVTVTPEKQAAQRLPLWSEKVVPQGWPFIGGVADRSVLVFAKTAAGPPGSPFQQVWVRHEYQVEQSDSADDKPLAAYRSERLVQEVDCGHQTFRTLKAYRHSDNNLRGREQTLSFTEMGWTTPEPDTFDANIVRSACFEP